jgi:SAM-dependent MidA family methyltransferase
VVDVGAGRGELLRHLYALAPGRPLCGLDVVSRPPDLPEDVGWVESRGGGSLPEGWRPVRALVVAHEWLDVVPCTIAEVGPDGTLREVLVDPATGAESPGPPLTGADHQWCQRFWPSALARQARAGDRVEVGRQRDDAWAALLDRLARGSVALAVDYGHTVDDRPRQGTLVAYREGRLVDPVPDGSRDLTAHVAVDSLRQTHRMLQRDAIEAVPAPDHALAAADPAAYLEALAERSAVTALRSVGGFGDFWWVIAQV